MKLSGVSRGEAFFPPSSQHNTFILSIKGMDIQEREEKTSVARGLSEKPVPAKNQLSDSRHHLQVSALQGCEKEIRHNMGPIFTNNIF